MSSGFKAGGEGDLTSELSGRSGRVILQGLGKNSKLRRDILAVQVSSSGPAGIPIVGGFSIARTNAEASMVGPRKGDHNLLGLLVHHMVGQTPHSSRQLGRKNIFSCLTNWAHVFPSSRVELASWVSKASKPSGGMMTQIFLPWCRWLRE